MTDTITLNGITYQPIAEPAEHRIVISQRGWVFVGRYEQDGEQVTLHDASVIRTWGTTKGLGELANGPLAGTKLDPAGTVRLHVLGIVATIDAPGWPS